MSALEQLQRDLAHLEGRLASTRHEPTRARLTSRIATLKKWIAREVRGG